MTRRVSAKERKALGRMLPVGPRSGGRPMIAAGHKHELHRVGEPLGATGARAAACRLVGDFFDPPWAGVPPVRRLLGER